MMHRTLKLSQSGKRMKLGEKMKCLDFMIVYILYRGLESNYAKLVHIGQRVQECIKNIERTYILFYIYRYTAHIFLEQPFRKASHANESCVLNEKIRFTKSFDAATRMRRDGNSRSSNESSSVASLSRRIHKWSFSYSKELWRQKDTDRECVLKATATMAN